MTDTITLPRSALEQALNALHLGISMYPNGGTAAVTIQATIDALRAALEQPHDHPEQHLDMVPAGWKLVPVEPTEDMLAAVAWPGCAATDWEHMLAAAPQPPVVEQLQSVTDCHQSQPQGEQKPIAYEFYNPATGHAIVDYSEHTHVGHLTAAKGYIAKPLFCHPQPRQPLTVGQINRLIADGKLPLSGNPYEVARAIERAHGIGGEA